MRSAVGMLPTTRVVVAPVFDSRINLFSALTSLHHVPGSQHNFGDEGFVLLEPMRNLREPSAYLLVSVYKAEDFLCFEGREILKHLPEIEIAEGEELDEYQETVKKLVLRFDKQPSIVVLRHKFFKRAQLQNESIDEFVSALRKLCAQCQFGTFRDQLVRDQLIGHCVDKHIQQRLLTMGDPSLEDVIKQAKSIELAQASLKELPAQRKEEEKVNINVVSARKELKSVTNQFFKRTNICFRCGNFPHAKESKGCPTKSVVCHKCGRIGHFAKVCQSSVSKNIKVNCVCEASEVSEQSLESQFHDMIVVVTYEQAV
ncbi:hypothetical protein NDU88_002749 [Pleurodeles waltl]|uniref:CCHC-type domain-containing protein n=1 Tax=Pleurodeles waltl TaxID=8319 RepID=A0AAV7Q6Y0_PLEWA|nr:hypothetical protein NDU88_002749 [Pleurodeles waltl]